MYNVNNLYGATHIYLVIGGKGTKPGGLSSGGSGDEQVMRTMRRRHGQVDERALGDEHRQRQAGRSDDQAHGKDRQA